MQIGEQIRLKNAASEQAKAHKQHEQQMEREMMVSNGLSAVAYVEYQHSHRRWAGL